MKTEKGETAIDQVFVLRTLYGGKPMESKFKKMLDDAHEKVRKKFGRLAPQADELVKTCTLKNETALAIVVATEFERGLSSEASMVDALNVAKYFVDNF